MEIFQTIWTALITENETLVNLLGIPLVILEMLVTILLSISILNIRTNKKSVALYVTIVSTLSIVSNFFIPNQYKVFINLIITPIIIMLIFKTNILKSILAVILPIIVIVFSELIFVKLFSSIFSVSQDTMKIIPIYRESIALLDYLFIFVLYRLARYFHLQLSLLDELSKRIKLIFIINFIIGIIAIASQLYLISFYYNILPIYITVISVIALITYFILSFYSLINTTNLAVTKLNLEQEKEHNRILKLAQDDLRGFRHDFANIMCTIGGYVHVEDMKGLSKYFSQIQRDIIKVNNLSALNPAVINNPAIFTLIASKYDKATENNVTMNINCFLDLNNLNMKIYEFTRVLGILLDNAIEAAKECDEKVINLEIRKDTKRNRQLLIIENTYQDKEIDTNKIYEKNYSTKEGNSGLGLWEVRQILKRNNNLNLFTTANNDFFKQQLEMYN